jgi:hypothetical protein
MGINNPVYLRLLPFTLTTHFLRLYRLLLGSIHKSQSRRDSLFKEEVLTQDFEEYDGDITKAKAVSRNLVLPLPSSFAEAAEWGTR